MEPTEQNLKCIRCLGGAILFVSLTAIIVLLSSPAHAIDPPAGFQPGGKSFNNPYAAPPSQPGQPFFDEDDEDFEMDYGNSQLPPRDGGGSAGGGGGVSYDTASNRGGGGGIQIGGSQKGIVNEGPRSAAQPYAMVDDEGGSGSNELITDFNFPDADILDIAKALGKLTGKNFILDKDVKGKISIISNSPITVREAWRAFLTALDMTNFALIPSGKFIRIARQRDARDKQLRTFTGAKSPDSDALITRLFRLKYLSADEVARNFRSFMPANSRIIPYEQTNTVIVTDTGSNIAKLSKLLDILDVEGYDAGIEVIPVKFASAAELAKLVDTLIPGNAAGPSAGPRFPGSGGSRFTARKTKEGGIINTVIADERTNNLIVHANSRGADQVRDLVKKLDKTLPAQIGGGKVHVIYLQFADAEALSNTLNGLGSSAGSAARPGGAGGAAGGTGSNPVQASLFEGSIKVAADKSTNSLVVTATPNDFATVQRVVNRLDIPRDQVYAEVVIMEMSLSKKFDMSVNVMSPKNGLGSVVNGDLAKFVANPLSSTGAILGFKAGGTKTFNVGGQNVEVRSVEGLINAMQTNSNATVLATPQILTLDNTEALFDSVEKIPTIQTTLTNGIQQATPGAKEDVGISIKLKPSINKMSNFVRLEIEAKLQDFSGRELPGALGQGGLATTSRQAKTTITVADGDTVVMGGLTRDKQTKTVSKIPLLGDIPVLGWLFRATKDESDKINLLLFITPKIIRQYEKIRTVLDQKLKERDDFIETSVGGNDTNRAKRDDIIRSLPDLNALKNNRPQTNFSIDNRAEQASAGGLSAPSAPAQQQGTRATDGNMGTAAPANGLPPVQPGQVPVMPEGLPPPGTEYYGDPNYGGYPMDQAPMPPPAADFGG